MTQVLGYLVGPISRGLLILAGLALLICLLAELSIAQVTDTFLGDRHGNRNDTVLLGGDPLHVFVVVVGDDDIDVFDDRQVEWALATRFQADDDILVIEGARGSTLDPSADGTTAKLGLDATVPVGEDRELFRRVT